jgi:predicted transposase YbfD/YdcC
MIDDAPLFVRAEPIRVYIAAARSPPAKQIDDMNAAVPRGQPGRSTQCRATARRVVRPKVLRPRTATVSMDWTATHYLALAESVLRFLTASNNSRRIENSLTWVLDLAFVNAQRRVHVDHAAQNFTIPHRIAVGSARMRYENQYRTGKAPF